MQDQNRDQKQIFIISQIKRIETRNRLTNMTYRPYGIHVTGERIQKFNLFPYPPKKVTLKKIHREVVVVVITASQKN